MPYPLLIGLVTLFGYLCWRHRWRPNFREEPTAPKLADEAPNSSSSPFSGDASSEIQAADLNSDEHADFEEDRRVLQEYTWASYNSLPTTMRRGIEPLVLRCLLQNSYDVSYDACSACLLNHNDVRALLLDGWEKGTFSGLRSNSNFLLLANPPIDREDNRGTQPFQVPSDDTFSERPGATGAEPAPLLGTAAGEVRKHASPAVEEVTGTKEHSKTAVLDIQGGEFVAGGDIYNVAGDIWRVTYLNYDRSIAEWFFPIDYRITHNEISKKRSKKTGGWLLRSKTFGEWCTSPQSRVMWCPGIPGVGKTVMASLIVDHLRTFDESRTFIGVIYFNYKLRDQQSQLAILEALCRQMFEFGQSPTLQALYSSHAKQKSRPTESELRSALSAAVQEYQYYHLVLDAFDEYTAHYSDKQVRGIVETILSLGVNVKLLITSRVIGEMKTTFAELGASSEEIVADDEDMRAYLLERVDVLRFKLDFGMTDEFSKLLIDKVIEAAKGRFLVAELGMNLLSEQLNLGDLEDVLEKLPKDIDETYIRVMELLQNYPDAQRKLAMKALMWIAFANRALSVRELQHALATKHGKKETDKYVTPLSTITGLCAGLIVVQDPNWEYDPDGERIVQFVREWSNHGNQGHAFTDGLLDFTTHEFFQEFQPRYFPNVHKEMFATCIDYLSIAGNHILAADFIWKETLFWERKAHLPFYDYAALNWGHHATTHHEPLPEVLEFLQRNDRPVLLSCDYMLSKWWDGTVEEAGASIFLAAYHDQANVLPLLLNGAADIPLTESQRTPLHIAAIAGKINTFAQLLRWTMLSQGNPDSTGGDIRAHSRMENERGAGGSTPLGDGIRHGRGSIARMLIENENVEVDLKDEDARSPFYDVAQAGGEPILKLLIEHDRINVDSKDKDGRTPFSYAAEGADEWIIKLLLEHGGVNVDSKDRHGRTPFSYAAEGGYEPIFKLLLEHGGLDVNSNDNNSWTPFSYAAQRGNETIVKLLLEHGGVDVDPKDVNGRTPFLYAAREGRESVIKLLLEHGGVDVNLKDIDDRTPFSYAVLGDHELITKLLLKHAGINTELMDTNGRTPFSHVAQWGKESIAKLLLDHEGIEVDSKDDYGRTPFTYAVLGGNKSVIELLLEHGGVDVDLKDDYGRTPFSYAVLGDNESIIKLLLEHGGVDVESKDNWGQTPFSHAAQDCRLAAIQILLQNGGVHINTQDNDGRTALSWASAGDGQNRGQPAILGTIQLLLEQGVGVNIADKEGKTALYYARQFVKSSDWNVGWQCVVDLLEANGAVELPLSTEVDGEPGQSLVSISE